MLPAWIGISYAMKKLSDFSISVWKKHRNQWYSYHVTLVDIFF